MTAVDSVCSGATDSAFALVGPPGYHASAALHRGFCLINNVAVAARHARAVHGIERVLIVDWDIHHGNGTASIFDSNPDVLFFDVHRAAPFYPGSGALEDTGRGTMLNVPLPEGSRDLATMRAFDDILIPAARKFRPQLILVSAGFDGTREHLACCWSTNLYGHLTGKLMCLAYELCGGRLVLLLEGGYHIDPMQRALEQSLRVLLDPNHELPPIQKSRVGLPAVRRASLRLSA